MERKSVALEASISAAGWRLESGQALRLPIGPGPRELQVTAGRLWLTRRGQADLPAPDVWLAPGESLAVESGEELVLEAWPEAQFQLLVPPRACGRSRWAAAFRR